MGFRWKRSLLIFHILSFWNGYFANVNIFTSVLCMWMINVYILRKIAAHIQKERERVDVSHALTWYSHWGESKPKPKPEHEMKKKTGAYHMRSIFFISNSIIIIISFFPLIAAHHSCVYVGGGSHLKEKHAWMTFYQLMCNIFPFQHSILVKFNNKAREKCFEVWYWKWETSVICQYGNSLYCVLTWQTYNVNISTFTSLFISWV